MSPEQYTRWMDFAERMARTYPDRSPEFRARCAELVAGFVCQYTDDGRDIARVSGWDDQQNGNGYPCDAFAETLRTDIETEFEAPEYWEADTGRGPTKAYEEWEERYLNPVVCCVRAGLDMASAPSMGVLGFTVGDLRRMYETEGRVPAWIVTGLNTEGRPLTEAEFAGLPDGEGLWL